LEPCAGEGEFIESIVRRFEENLTNDRKYILENCIYIIDISQNNIDHIQERFNPNGNIQLNILQYDTLSVDVVAYFGYSFDAVITNPPFNTISTSINRNIIWNHFVKKAIECTKDNGYVALITPTLWRKPNFTGYEKVDGLFQIIAQTNQLLYLNINSIQKGKEYFNAGTPFDYYVIHKVQPYKPTIINDMYENEIERNLYKWSWCPNYNFDLVQELLAKENEKRAKIFYNRSAYAYEGRKPHVSREKNETFRYPLVHNFNKNGAVFLYSSRNDILGENDAFGKTKIIVGDFIGYNDKYVFDREGQYGLTNHSAAIYIDDENEKDKIIEALQSRKLKEFVESVRWSQNRIDWRVFRLFKKDWYNYFVS